jgi:hypothetical protein
MLTRTNPYSTAYDQYGDPYKLVEFRMMVLNHCSMDCKGCFYKRIDNNYNDFLSAKLLAEDMKSNGYKLETCYLLPTDIFDNKENYLLFKDSNFSDMISQFSYIGIASTLEDGYDTKFFDLVFGLNDTVRIELQVNLLISKLFDINYQTKLKYYVNNLKLEYGNRIVINLAINTGFELSEKEKNKIKKMLKEFSEDGIIELNFTFLYNNDIPDDKKKKMLKTSIRIIQDFGDFYEKDDSFVTKYNQRTFLRKPSFVFVGNPNKIYANPIVPFDEYVFVKKDKYLVKTPNYDGFLNSYGEISELNRVVIPECDSCDNLSHCMGKFYFAIANEFNLGCFLNIKD